MKNIILITVDCLRPDHLNCYGYKPSTSPYISGLAKKGIIYTEMYANSSYTCASVASMITSTHPFDFHEGFGFSTPAIISRKRTLLSQILKSYGYTNAFFHDNPYLSKIFGYARGFDTFVDFGARKSERAVKRARETVFGKNARVRRLLSRINKLRILYEKWYRKNIALNIDCEILLKEAYKRIKRLKSPYFIWCHLMDTHVPYSPKHEALNSIEYSRTKALYLIYKHWGMQIQLTKSELELFKRLYDLQILRIDEALKEYLPKLVKNDFENTFIIITADHGEEFMEHGKIGHSTPLSETLLHVPLIISGGGLERKIVHVKSSLLDLAPTILDVLGLKEYNGFKGRSLLNIKEGRPVTAQGIFRGKKHECIL